MLLMKGLVQEFIFDCKVRNLAPRTIHNCEKQLNYFTRYLSVKRDCFQIEQYAIISKNLIIHPINVLLLSNGYIFTEINK